MSDSINKDPSREAIAERVLREGLKANVLTPEALQRIRQATEQEWRAVTRAPARRGWRPLAAVASVFVLAAGIAWAYLALSPQPVNGAILGELASFDAPGMIEMRPFRRDVVLAEGSNLRAGQALEVRGDSLVTLNGGGNLRLARATAIDVRAENAISLKRGELYVDIPPGSQASGAFRVMTDAGEFHHEGTQFAVAIVEGQTRLRVREGRVLWRAVAGDSTVDAGTEVLIDRSGKATRRTMATAGRDWAWMESMSPEIAIENRPLLEFLEWFARETGRKLVIDDAARLEAANIRMHGNMRALTVAEALSAVMATTTLRYELPEGVIRVSSTRESKTPVS
jgi:hypothetical protein